MQCLDIIEFKDLKTEIFDNIELCKKLNDNRKKSHYQIKSFCINIFKPFVDEKCFENLNPHDGYMDIS